MATDSPSRRGVYIRLLFGVAMACAAASLYWYSRDLLTIASLRKNHSTAVGLVGANPRLAPLCYIGILTAILGLSCPGATMVSFVGGIIFDQPYASVYASVAYVGGALTSFLINSFLLGDYLREKLADKSDLYQRFESNARKNAFLYLVAARFTMVFPFFFVNAAAALVGVHWATFTAASSVSCIPGAVIYTTAGGALANLLHTLDDNATVDTSELVWRALFDPNVVVCMIALVVAGCIALVVAYITRQTDKPRKFL